MALPLNVAPVSPDVRRKNEFHPGEIFPFRTWRSLPSFPTAALNASISAGTLLVGAAGLLFTVAVVLPIGIVKSIGDSVAGCLARLDEGPVAGNHRRCVVITGASSGMGAALALEYASPNTHLVLLARDATRLDEIASRAKSKGATAAVHSLDFFHPSSTIHLHRLLQEIDNATAGIDIAISCASVTGHRSDVLGLDVEHIPSLDHSHSSTVDDGNKSESLRDTPDIWGATTASRILQCNVAASQEFILRCWELMKARQRQRDASSRQKPKIIVLSSSTAFFTPANFALYAASKAYLYSLARSLQIASVPYGIGVVVVTPGFIKTGMTETMRRAGATVPEAILGDPEKIARKIRCSEENGGRAGVVFYPALQVWALFSLRALNPVLETLGMWVGAATGVATWFFS